MALHAVSPLIAIPKGEKHQELTNRIAPRDPSLNFALWNRTAFVLSTAYSALVFLPSSASIQATGRCTMGIPSMRIFRCTKPHLTSTFPIAPFVAATQSTDREKEASKTGFFTMHYIEALIAARPAISGSTALVSTFIAGKNCTSTQSDPLDRP